MGEQTILSRHVALLAAVAAIWGHMAALSGAREIGLVSGMSLGFITGFVIAKILGARYHGLARES